MMKFLSAFLEQRKIAVNAVFLLGRLLVTAFADVLAVGIVLRALGQTGYGAYSAVVFTLAEKGTLVDAETGKAIAPKGDGSYALVLPGHDLKALVLTK